MYLCKITNNEKNINKNIFLVTFVLVVSAGQKSCTGEENYTIVVLAGQKILLVVSKS